MKSRRTVQLVIDALLLVAESVRNCQRQETQIVILTERLSDGDKKVVNRHIVNGLSHEILALIRVLIVL